MYLLYNLGLGLASVVLLPWIALRVWRGRLHGFGERMGRFKWKEFEPGTQAMWIHAVSLGEVKSAAALIDELRRRMPNLRFVITSSTQTGWNAAKTLMGSEGRVFFPPFDIPFVCRRFLRRIRPNAVVVLETELWPNLFRESKRFGAALIIANGRISDRTFPRYLSTRFLWRRVLSLPDSLFVQSAEDADRYIALGVPPARVQTAGNLKFASRPTAAPLAEALVDELRKVQAGPVIVAGSTMGGEEGYLLDAFEGLLRDFPRLWMILAPRHPERFVEVRGQIEARGIPLQLRSQWKSGTPVAMPGIFLLDGMGELGALYELATIAFVGGTLVETGGHNILEPAFFGRPIIVGPSMTNFQEIADEFLKDAGLEMPPLGRRVRTGAIIQIPDAASLVLGMRFLLQNPAFCRGIGDAARERWRTSRSGVAAVIDEITALLEQRTANAGSSAAIAGQSILNSPVKAE